MRRVECAGGVPAKIPAINEGRCRTRTLPALNAWCVVPVGSLTGQIWPDDP
jgi:hypothetical protein